MKLLGHDIHTQEEFDQFYSQEFKPLVDTSKKTLKSLKACMLFSVVSLLASVSALITVALTVPK